MAQIGTFTRDENGAYAGTIKTLTLNVKATIKPCDRDNDKAPDYRVTTNGIEFAKSKEFARKAAEAGLRYVYLQFDGIGNAANSHRQVGNLFDVKLKAIDNLHAAGVEIVLVTTLVNTVNNDEVGPVIRFALDNPKKIGFISFQPVSFTGRDEDITDDRRLRQRYTLSHMAHDVRKQVGITDPHKDWFPISLMSAFADFADMAHGPDREWGQMSCGCHPNCGVGTAVMIDKETKEMKPVPDFINIPGLIGDMRKITDAARSKKFSMAMMALALLKNYNSFGAPTHFKLSDLLQKFDKTFGLSGKDYGKSDPTRTIEDVEKRRKDRWNFLFIGGSTLVTTTYTPEEKTRAQGAVDFCVYATMTLTSFSSGALVTTGGWTAMNQGALLPLALMAAALVWLARLRPRQALAA